MTADSIDIGRSWPLQLGTQRTGHHLDCHAVFHCSYSHTFDITRKTPGCTGHHGALISSSTRANKDFRPDVLYTLVLRHRKKRNITNELIQVPFEAEDCDV